MHDMSLTEKYVVIYDQPVTVNFDMLATHSLPFDGIRLRKSRGFAAKKGVAKDIVWIDMPMGFSPMNAYDNADGSVTIDLCNYSKMSLRDLLGPLVIAKRLEHWTLNPVTRSVNIQVIDETPNEFPGIGGDSTTYRFSYCASPSNVPGQGWPTLKHDLNWRAYGF